MSRQSKIMQELTTEQFATALSKLGRLPPDAPQGVLDIGSNSVRLVGFSGSARTPLPIYNERAFVRLGESVSATGRIEGDYYTLALSTFRRFRKIADQLGIDKLAAFATAAVREAENRDAFLADAEKVLGHKIRILSGEEEAALSADGVMLGIPGAEGIVADLGGGSLELAYVSDNQTRHWASLPLGVLALQQASNGKLKTMEKIIGQALGELDWLAQARGKPIYIVGGTWRALAKLHMDYSEYGLEVLHQYEMRPKEIASFFKFMAKNGRRAQRIMSRASGNRREALPAASLVLQEMMDMVRPSRLIVSANAVREGVLYQELKSKHRALDPLLMACEEMAARSCKSEPYSHELAMWTRQLYRHATPKNFSHKQINRLRQAGCLISDLAWASHPSFRAAAVSNAVLTAPFTGITHGERVFLSRALSYRHEMRDTETESAPDFGALSLTPTDDKLARALGLSQRLAHSLSASLPGVLAQTKLKVGRVKLKLTISPALANLAAPIIDKRMAALAEALDLQPVVRVRALKEIAPSLLADD
jgi:exopolyphosphatase/guanosine-5'-triphosphate,3'-diphosphate pyrophosphatase